MHTKLELGVNIDHVATLRQARGVDYPDVVQAARVVVAAGANGVTVHLREDRRHIQDADVYAIRREQGIRLNLEMAVHPEIVDIAVDVKPDEACLVPEKRAELTTEGGLDVAGNPDQIRDVVSWLDKAGVLVSLFIDPDTRQIEAAAEVGAPVIELHTGAFCNASGEAAQRELDRLIAAAEKAHALGITVNAGHGINLDTIGAVLEVPHLHTLNIGHSIVAHAVFVGLENAVKAMLNAMEAYNGGRHG